VLRSAKALEFRGFDRGYLVSSYSTVIRGSLFTFSAVNVQRNMNLPPLPPEIWRFICRLATSLPGILDTTPLVSSIDESRAWSNTYLPSHENLTFTAHFRKIQLTKLNLMLVCKSWSDMGRELLYENILIRDETKLFQLGEALQSNRLANRTYQHGRGASVPHVGSFTRRLCLQYEADDANLEKGRAVLKQILGLCPNIRVLICELPKFLGPVHPMQCIPSLLRTNCPSLRCFWWNSDDAQTVFPVDSLKSHSELEMIRLHIEGGGVSRSLKLPELHTLNISGSAIRLLAKPERLIIPALRVLIVGRDLQIPLTFFNVHGHSLLSLTVKHSSLDIHTILSCCPSLETLTAKPSVFNAELPPHGNLSTVYLETNTAACSCTLNPMLVEVIPRFSEVEWPSLEHVRLTGVTNRWFRWDGKKMPPLLAWESVLKETKIPIEDAEGEQLTMPTMTIQELSSIGNTSGFTYYAI
jgi:hypothetical protein